MTEDYYELINKNYNCKESNKNLNDLLLRTLRDRPENEDKIRGII